ncbi:hypothetical protein [Embleya sp. NBC_00896]|uniref:hypothetical protein n=1 Tax=Embleya sp. NBC_00896 TaxID=2975961 RepID=UPI0038649ED7|nr:hypothetical protein OG928_07885 [Embleya sp. NBC_00896]
MTPVFFTSRSCGDERAYVERFHSDLEQAVSARVAGRDGARGLLSPCVDRDPGDPPESLAACSFPAAVVLASPDYLADPAAMREWAVMAERVRGHRVRTGEQLDAMVIVRWRATESRPGEQPTPDLGADGDYGPIYSRQGLFDLMRLEGHSADYRRLIAELARVVVEVNRVPLRPLPPAEARELVPAVRTVPSPAPARMPYAGPAPVATAARALPTHSRTGPDLPTRPRWITARHNPRRPLLWGPGGDVEEH